MDKVVYKDRKCTDSMKWDGCMDKFGEENLLPMWVADMDFEAPGCVKDALKKYVDFGVFGYHIHARGYEDAFIRWEETCHHYQVKREWIRFAPGVVPAINWLIHLLTGEADGVMIMPPVYYPFRDAIVNNRRKTVESPLVRTREGYVIDYEDVEQKIVDNEVKMLLFCSPHNPVGRVWKEDEIRRLLDICKRHHVYVIADEIHQDIVMRGHRHIVAASTGEYDDSLITLTAGSKTFNLAACQNSILVIPNEKLRRTYDGYLKRLSIKEGNPFGYIAVQSAYEHGREWLDEVLHIIESNYRYLKDTLKEALPDLWIADLEGTYLLWMDLGAYVNPEEMKRFIQGKCGLAVDYGSWFGGDESARFIRVNLATHRRNLELAAQRIIQALR